MRKTFLLVVAALCATFAAAQVEVKSITELPGTANKGFYHPKFSEQGDALYLTAADFRGLSKYNLANHSVKTISTLQNAGNDLQVSEGGKVAVFRDFEMGENNLRLTSIKRLNMETGEVTTLAAPSREKYSFRLESGVVRVAQRSRVLTQRLVTSSRPVENKYVLAIENRDLVLYTNNVRRVLNPKGEGSYIWPSVSPDHQHMTFTYIKNNSVCTYVCDMNGENMVSFGYIGAAQWLGNNYLVGMLDIWDDGHRYTHSPLVTVRIDGKNRQIIPVPNHEVVLYPAASVQGDKIAFEADGAVYLMNVEIKD